MVAVEMISRVRNTSSIKHKHRAGLCYFVNDGGKGEQKGTSQGVSTSVTHVKLSDLLLNGCLKWGGEEQNKQPSSVTMKLL